MATVSMGLRFLVVLLALVIATEAQVAQVPTSQSPAQPTPPTKFPPVQGTKAPAQVKLPDMVCFGHGPDWSIQFLSGEARYVGTKQPDQYFLGDFYWVPQDNSWSWHRQDGLTPTTGAHGVSATIQKATCKDPVRKQAFPYSAQVNLPQGDIVHGCCRKLKPGEAPVGPHGIPPTPPTSPPHNP